MTNTIYALLGVAICASVIWWFDWRAGAPRRRLALIVPAQADEDDNDGINVTMPFDLLIRFAKFEDQMACHYSSAKLMINSDGSGKIKLKPNAHYEGDPSIPFNSIADLEALLQ